jgi:hypothetical protein
MAASLEAFTEDCHPRMCNLCNNTAANCRQRSSERQAGWFGSNEEKRFLAGDVLQKCAPRLGYSVEEEPASFRPARSVFSFAEGILHD